MLRKILTAFFGLSMLALPLGHADQGNDASQRWHWEQRTQEVYGQLNLSDEQKKQVETNKLQYRAKMMNVRRQVKVNRQLLREEMMKPQMDMPKINAIHRQIKSLSAQSEDNRLASTLAVRSILTPEQFSKFINLMHKDKK